MNTPTQAKAAPPFAAPRPKVPPFAGYKGTSAWRKDRRRAREYARFRAAATLAKQMQATAVP